MKKSTTKSGSTRKRSSEASAEVQPEARPAIDEYNAIVNVAELLSVHLMQARGEFRPEKMGDDDNLVLRVAPPQYRGQFSPENSTISCGVRLILTLENPAPETTAAEAAGDAVVEVFAEYRITYKLPKNTVCEERIVKFFAARNALFNTWPFFRELAFSLVGKMGVPPLVTPLLRLPPLSQAGLH